MPTASVKFFKIYYLQINFYLLFPPFFICGWSLSVILPGKFATLAQGPLQKALISLAARDRRTIKIPLEFRPGAVEEALNFNFPSQTRWFVRG